MTTAMTTASTKTARQRMRVVLAPVLLLLLCVAALTAKAADVGEPSLTDGLAVRQGRVAGRFSRLEQLMLKMAEVDASSNPRRAALLRQAVQQSKRNGIQLNFEKIVKLLERQRLKPALDGQVLLQGELQKLLELLLTENRPDRLQSEQARIKEYIKELRRIGRVQKGLIGRTEGNDDIKRLAREQKRAAERTEKLADRIDQDSPESENKGEAEQSDSKKGAGKKSGEKKSPGKKPGDDDKKTGEEKAGDKQSKNEPDDKKSSPDDKDKKPQDPSSKSNGPQNDKPKNKSDDSQEKSPSGEQPPQPGDGQPPKPGGKQSQGKPSQPSPQSKQDEPPAQKRIEAAEKKMREAQQKLEDAQRREAIDEQREAQRLINEAIAELEEILRQMREEELERTLAMLEGRFRKMLEMELRVYESTLRLAKIPAEKRGREVDIQSGKLSFEQRRISVEADKALLLLREEGSSIAFPETVEQMREDMEQVTDFLANTRIGSLTQSIEEDIISSLEEIIEALNIAQQEQQERKQQQQQQQQQQGKPGDQPLVDAIAELKMVRALQMRVNRRTKSYAALLIKEDDPVGQAKDDLRDSIRRLADREQRIQKITSDIVLGKNK